MVRTPKQSWRNHIEGAMGEFVISKVLDKHWAGKGEPGECDVSNVDVRTRSEHSFDLMLHPEDDGSRAFWLVTGFNGQYIVHGWIYGRDGKQECYWKDKANNGRDAYFVPKSQLNREWTDEGGAL